MNDEQPETEDLKDLIKMEVLINVVAQAVDALQRGQVEMAAKGFESIRRIVEAPESERLRPILPLAILGQSLVLQKQGQPTEAGKIREQAVSLLGDDCKAVPMSTYHYFVALILQRQQDHRHALPFWELALEHSNKETNPMRTAEMLHQVGECYCHIGLTDHAAIPLRAALKILEICPEHPWHAAALLTLGNALRKNHPAEAEKYYRQAAEVHASRLQYQSAAPAWVNLGVLCSEQGRYTEALEFYQKVLRVREGNASTPPGRIAIIHNNIANVYRRMKHFDEALSCVDRSIAMFPIIDTQRAYAYSTRAMILRDAGRDEEAVEWFRKAIVERNRQPSPNLGAAADDLQGQIDALKRLGRISEVHNVEKTLESLQGEMKAILPLAQSTDEFARVAGGSIFVEIAIGSNQADPVVRDELRRFVYEVHEEALSRGIGRLSGHITLPESRTLIFSGPDAEELFKGIEPMLVESRLFAGAHVTIRQNDQRREFVMPRSATAVN
jgi:tetratricopeptide (TPR) repeat protein